MAQPILCKICGKRRARRSCPAVNGDICAICCGTEREVSLSCPLHCEYLQEAHRREKPVPVDYSVSVYPDVSVSENFVREHEELLLFCVYSLVQAALRTPGSVDTDVLASLKALIQTHRTLDSGLLYETRAENALAESIQRSFSASLADYQKVREERETLSSIRNSEIIATLVFLYRIGLQNQNGKPRGRMFLDFLRQMAPDTRVEERAPSIIL
jgi:hypothetical protein